MEKEFVCIVCPIGCRISVIYENKEVISLSGNRCPRGEQYVRNELSNPQRTLASTMRVVGGHKKLVSVKTSAMIPKTQIEECMNVINQSNVTAPITMHQVLVENILGLGIDVIATMEINKED